MNTSSEGHDDPTDDPADDTADARDHASEAPEFGSVGEEAVKLFGALSDWANGQGADASPDLSHGLADGLSGLAGQAAAAARNVSEHVDTGAAECSYCPVCRTVHAVRQASPEVRDHLATAAASLMQAAAGVLAATARGGEAGRRGDLERIDLDVDGDGAEWPGDEQ